MSDRSELDLLVRRYLAGLADRPESCEAAECARNIPWRILIVTYSIAVAREKGISAYIGEGLNRWPVVHVLDAAHLYRLAIEKGTARARYHAVAEEGVPAREIAEAIGQGLKIPVVAISPEEAAGHFGWLGFFAGMDMPASSALTQQRLGWHPTQKPGLIADLDQVHYFEILNTPPTCGVFASRARRCDEEFHVVFANSFGKAGTEA